MFGKSVYQPCTKCGEEMTGIFDLEARHTCEPCCEAYGIEGGQQYRKTVEMRDAYQRQGVSLRGANCAA